MSRRAVIATMTLLAVCAVDASSPSDAQNIDQTAANRIYASFDLSRPITTTFDLPSSITGVPKGIRTPVTAVKVR